MPPNVHDAASPSTQARCDNDTLVRSIVAGITENQADTVARMAKEAIEGIMKEKQTNLADELEERILKKEKLTEPVFKNEGNKNQFKHQKAIWENMETIEKAVKSKDMDKALKQIAEGKKLVLKRIKLIKLAEREDWGTVKEYMSDDLASGTDDEKAINKAIKSAATKREKRRKYRASAPTSRSRNDSHRLFRKPGAQFLKSSDTTRQTCCSCGKIGHFSWQCYANPKRDSAFSRSARI